MNRRYLACLKSLLLGLILVPFLALAQTAVPGPAASPAPQQDQGAQPECAAGETCSSSSDNVAAESGSDDSRFAFSEVLDTEGLLQSWQRQINNVLQEYGLSASFVGKTISSVVILLIALILSYVFRRLLTRVLSKLDTLGGSLGLNDGRLKMYRRILLFFIRLCIAVLTIVAILAIWGDPFAGVLSGEQLGVVFGRLIGLVILLIVGIAVFELVSVALEHFFTRMAQDGSPRVLTLLPIARNVAYGALLVLFGITLISELGVNVMPLLAGAGVVGFAVGFGAQTFIKDIITGFIIIVEDLIQVGDVAGVGGRTGLVEKITIRKVQLRDLSGTVYTVPFSEIGIVENLTKDFSYYLMDIGVAYRENTDEVIKLLRKISDEMQQDEKYKDNILEPIDILGVDKFADSAVIVKARIKTRPIKQWEVGREFNRRMKQVFDENNIEIPFPHRTLYFGEGKNGEAPSAKVELLRDMAAANDSVGNKPGN